MAKSALINLSDIQEVLALLGECRELGDDPVVWRRHLFEATSRLVDADVVAGGELTGCLGGPQKSPGVALWGFEHGFNIEGLQIIWEWSVTAPDRSELWNRVQKELRATPSTGVTTPRQQLLTDREWDRTPDLQIAMRTMGADAVVHSFCPLSEEEDYFDGVCWFRATGRPTFNEREVALLTLIHREASRMIGGPLARFDEPRPTQLPPRARQVLRCLLEGDADKQVAHRLSLSAHTVNQYTKQIFRHFKVSGRTELLARWLRRGWGSRAAWDVGDASSMVLMCDEMLSTPIEPPAA
jgi:DNA-binding CsgD family transcriptional regulator